jgi:hypothetical protein
LTERIVTSRVALEGEREDNVKRWSKRARFRPAPEEYKEW